MGSYTDRAGRCLGRARMVMGSECERRPEGQHDTQTRYPLRDRTHESYPMDALFEFTPKLETKATRVPRRATLTLHEIRASLSTALAKIRKALRTKGADPAFMELGRQA